ncbi:MAG: peptidoglycan DD-metalloendopeptidase family protein [Rhodospirillaceae bacterium]|nr:peptidoglycan DD-metalloendopeptidase family protein [Rhodospirillaceae bacterium]
MSQSNTAPKQSGSKFRRVAARVFRERELLLRSDGRVRFLVLTPRLQKTIACFFAALLLWGASATIVSIVEYDKIAAADARLEDARIAYEDLLQEIAIYQRKVAEVTGKLKQNQAELVGRFADADALIAGDVHGNASEKSAGGRLAAITESRDAMRQHLRKLDQELHEMTKLDAVLADSLNLVQHELVTAVAERKKVYQARAGLQRRVKSLEDKLRQSLASNAKLEAQISTLNASLSDAQGEIKSIETTNLSLVARKSELENNITAAKAKEGSLYVEISALKSDLSAAQADYERISSERADLDVKAAALEGALRAEEERANVLEADMRKLVTRLGEETGDPGPHNPAKETLTERVALLLDRLTDIHQARSKVIESLNALAVGDIEDFERIIEMTGLDVKGLLAKVQADQELGQGGPFVALAATQANDSLAGAVKGLDTQLTHLEALKIALQAVPLISPVDTYRVASKFGKRRDPISKKWALHAGVDLAARSKTMIYASAPGVVTKAGWNGLYGRMIEIEHGFGIRTRYGHLRKILIKKGQTVRHREKIALMGSSGSSTGQHFHY